MDCKDKEKARIQRRLKYERAKLRDAEKLREYSRKSSKKRWKISAKFREKRKLESKKYAKSHPERIKAYNSKWYAALSKEGKQKHKENAYAWRLKNPIKFAQLNRQNQHRRRLQKVGSTHSIKQWLWRVDFYGWKCFYCGIKLTPATLTKDHRIPLSKNGTDWASNVVPACMSCNCHKRASFPAKLTQGRGVPLP